MSEKLIIEIPSETDEFQTAKNNFKWTLDLEVFSKFWGLYLMKIPIPKDIWDYVSKYKHLMPTKELHFAVQNLEGSPMEQDQIVRQMIFKEIM